MSDNSMKVFSGNAGYAGFYGPSAKGNDVTLTIARASKAKTNQNQNQNDLANSGFLADTYNIQWGRAVNVRRVFNNNKPIAVVGFGQGTITLQGLLGTYAGFKTIIGGDEYDSTEGNKDLCDPLIITIAGSGAYNACQNGEVVTGTQGGVNFKLTGCLLSTINVTGQIETQSGTLLQQANVTFSIGGFEILPSKKKITDGLARRNDAQFRSQMQSMYGGLA